MHVVFWFWQLLKLTFMAKQAKQTTLFGSVVAPPSKKKCTRDNAEKFKESWKEAAPWPKPPGMTESTIGLPVTWLKLVEVPQEGMMCLLCEKYSQNKPPPSGKRIWSVEPCTLFRLQSVHRHASSLVHKDAIRQEIDRQRSQSDGGVAQHYWEAEEKAILAAMSCVYFLAKEEIPHMTKYKPLLELLSFVGLP